MHAYEAGAVRHVLGPAVDVRLEVEAMVTSVPEDFDDLYFVRAADRRLSRHHA